MTLIDLIKNDLKQEDKELLTHVDLEKTDDEIIDDLEKTKVLLFTKQGYEDKKIQQD